MRWESHAPLSLLYAFGHLKLLIHFRSIIGRGGIESVCAKGVVGAGDPTGRPEEYDSDLGQHL